MFDFRARCRKTFWQMKTLQLCLALVSCSSGLVSGVFGFKERAGLVLACRYGVFEEHGYPGDERYPTFYTQQIWTANGPE